jgi:hypothetical protein
MGKEISLPFLFAQSGNRKEIGELVNLKAKS